MPTAFTLPLLFIISRHSLKLSPDGAFSPSTELKQIQDGIWMFSSSSSSTNACKLRRLTYDVMKRKSFQSNRVLQKFDHKVRI